MNLPLSNLFLHEDLEVPLCVCKMDSDYGRLPFLIFFSCAILDVKRQGVFSYMEFKVASCRLLSLHFSEMASPVAWVSHKIAL